MKQAIDAEVTFDIYIEAIESHPLLNEKDKRAFTTITSRVKSDSIQNILVGLVDSEGSRSLRYLVEERRSGRILAWRLGKGSPTAEQALRIRIAAWIASIHDRFGIYVHMDPDSVPPRYRDSPLNGMFALSDFEQIGKQAIDQVAEKLR